MSYPAGHIPEARDGVEGLLEQIATSVGAITDDASSIEDKLASIAVALQSAALVAGDAVATPAEATAVAAAIAAFTAAQNNATLAELGLVDSSAVTKWLISLGDGTLYLQSTVDSLTELIGGMTAVERAAWQQQILLTPPRVVTDANDTISLNDIGGMIVYNRGTDIEVTCPKTIPRGFSVCCMQQGNGQIHFVNGTDATITNADGHYYSKTASSLVTLAVYANSDGSHAQWVMGGSTAIAT